MVEAEELSELVLGESADKRSQGLVRERSLVVAGSQRFFPSLPSDAFKYVAVCVGKRGMDAERAALVDEVVVGSLGKAEQEILKPAQGRALAGFVAAMNQMQPGPALLKINGPLGKGTETSKAYRKEPHQAVSERLTAAPRILSARAR